MRFHGVQTVFCCKHEHFPNTAPANLLILEFFADDNRDFCISENPREFSDLERKKDSADVQFSRHLRKPRKRNGAEFF